MKLVKEQYKDIGKNFRSYVRKKMIDRIFSQNKNN